jgi:hypothetical protein
MKTSTVSIATYAYTLGLFHACDATFTHEGELVLITAHHLHDTSTSKYLDNVVGKVLVSVRTITNNKRAKGRKLADGQRKVLMDRDDLVTLTPTV